MWCDSGGLSKQDAQKTINVSDKPGARLIRCWINQVLGKSGRIVMTV